MKTDWDVLCRWKNQDQILEKIKHTNHLFVNCDDDDVNRTNMKCISGHSAAPGLFFEHQAMLLGLHVTPRWGSRSAADVI